MKIDGRAISNEIVRDLKIRRDAIARDIALAIVVASGDPVIESFVRIKAALAEKLGIKLVRTDLVDASTETAIEAVRALKRDPAVDGIIVQLPMPPDVDVNGVLSEVPMEKDIDAISPFVGDRDRIVQAPVALAVEEILKRSGVDPAGKRAVVIGAGRLVGQPVASLLRRAGADVSMLTLQEGSIGDLKFADIVVSGAGTPHFIQPEHLKEGVVLIDAGTSESGGHIQGDCDPSCAKIASVFTPVPGGVGPIAVSMIFKNVIDLAARR